MLKNYFTVAWRQIIRNKVHSIINVLGLTIGITAVLFVLLMLYSQFNHDKNIKFSDRTFRIYSNEFETPTPGVLAPGLQQNFAEIELYTRMATNRPPLEVSSDNKKYQIQAPVAADPSVADMFNLEFIYGTATDALNRPHSILLSRNEAVKIFGSENPVGRNLKVSSELTLTVCGVFENLPANSHLQMSAIIDFESLNEQITFKELVANRNIYAFTSYLRLKNGASKQQMDLKLKKFYIDNISKDDQRIYYLQDLDGMFFTEDNLKNIKIFSLIGLFVLLIAIVNFINLNTAVSALRSREIGLRKVLGAQKGGIIGQFLTESVLMSLISGFFSWLLFLLILPEYNQLTTADYSRLFLFKPLFLISYFCILVIIGVLAGLYPALRFSFFPLLSVLKKEVYQGVSGVIFRRTLIVFQFAVSIMLIASTIIIFRQLKFMQNMQPGFDMQRIVTLKFTKQQISSAQTFRQALENEPEIAGTGFSSRDVSHPFRFTATSTEVVTSPDSISNQVVKQIIVYGDLVDSGYVHVLGLKFIAGRNFIQSDSNGTCIINESMVKILDQTPQGIINKKIEVLDGNQVVGVVKDYHFDSMRNKIEPLELIRGDIFPKNTLNIRIPSNDLNSGINKINQLWRKFYPNDTINLTVLSDIYEEMYKPDKMYLLLFSIFAGIAIFIACLGSYGLAGFEALRRTKEIGIRKVFGAETSEILVIMLKEAFWLVIISGALAVPAAWWFVSGWLTSFAVRINPGWENFLIAVSSAMLIAVVCVVWVSLKTIRRNPIESLKYE